MQIKRHISKILTKGQQSSKEICMLALKIIFLNANKKEYRLREGGGPHMQIMGSIPILGIEVFLYLTLVNFLVHEC